MKFLFAGLAASLLSLMPAMLTAQADITANQMTSQSSEAFTVAGNEPFWSIAVEKTGITYGTPSPSNPSDPSKITFPYVAPLRAEGRTADAVRVYQLRAQTDRGTNGTLMIKRGNCNDTMSDRKYDYSATLILGNTVREGCAIKK
jgi:uncharacterized membrane protein